MYVCGGGSVAGQLAPPAPLKGRRQTFNRIVWRFPNFTESFARCKSKTSKWPIPDLRTWLPDAREQEKFSLVQSMSHTQIVTVQRPTTRFWFSVLSCSCCCVSRCCGSCCSTCLLWKPSHAGPSWERRLSAPYMADTGILPKGPCGFHLWITCANCWQTAVGPTCGIKLNWTCLHRATLGPQDVQPGPRVKDKEGPGLTKCLLPLSRRFSCQSRHIQWRLQT